MTSFYSFATFFRFFAAVVLIIVVFRVEPPPGRKRRIPVYLFTFCSLSAVFAWVLVPVCPFPEIRMFLDRLWPVLLIMSLPLLLMLLIFRPRNREELILERYSTQIVDHSRESLVVFNPAGKVVSSGRPEEFGGLFPLGATLGQFISRLPADLRMSLERRSDAGGECELSGKKVRYRLLPLPKGSGLLLLLTDITKETQLIKALEEREVQLRQRQRVLNHLERGEEEQGKRELRRNIAGRVESLVEDRLAGLTRALDREAPLDELLASAELSMNAIRQAVTELSPERSSR